METFSHIIAIFVLVWGLSFGLANICTRIYAMLVNVPYCQSVLGQLLDSSWIIGVIFLIYTKYWVLFQSSVIVWGV